MTATSTGRMLARAPCWALVWALAALLAGCGGGGGGGGSAPPPPPANRAPVADAGEDISQVIQPSPVTLDGSGSSDPDNDTLEYRWEVREQPANADTSLDDASSARPGFVPAAPGEYVFELTVSDPAGLSSTDTVTVTLTNEPPSASVSTSDRNAVIGADVTLDASASTDADDHALTFAWRVVELPDASGIERSLDGPVQTVRFDSPGRYVFELEIDDGYATTSVTLDPFDATVYVAIPLSGPVLDAEFDVVGERIVAVEGDTLRVIEPDGSEMDVQLPTAATAVSVSPDGASAAVGHDAWVSHVDLRTLRVLATYSVPADLGDVVLDGRGQAHGFPDTGQWVSLVSVDLASGAVQSSGRSIRHQTRARLHPSGTKMYGADNDLSPSDLERYSIVDGGARVDYDSPYHGEFPICGDVWFDPEGHTMLTPCGVVLRATDDRASDMRFVMWLEGLRDPIRHAASGAFDRLWYVIAESNRYVVPEEERRLADHIQTYDIENGQPDARFDLPFTDGAQEARWLARFVFPSANSEAHYVIASDGSDTAPRHVLLVRQASGFAGPNRAPTAVAPRFVTARVSEPVVLDASQSSDPEGVPLTYRWSLVHAPDDTVLAPSELTGSAVRFTPATAGVYEFELQVDDGERRSPVVRSTATVFEAGASLVHRLEHLVVDAEYSAALHALAYVSAEGNDLYILRLSDLSRARVRLDRRPHTVAVSPNGRMAAVSHSGAVSLVDLRTAQVTDTQAFPADWGDMVLDRHGRAHLVPYRDQWVSFYSLDFRADQATATGGPYAGMQLRMHPTRDWVYGADLYLSPSDLKKYDVGRFPPASLGDSPYHGDYPIGGNVWISEDGDRLLSAGGTTFRSSADPAVDMTYSGRLPDDLRAQWADHSAESGEWAVLTLDGYADSARRLAFFTDEFFNQASVSDLEGIPIPGDIAATSGTHVFQSEDGASVIVLLRGDGLFHEFAVQISDR